MLKGKTTIELTNVNTGEVEVYEDENMITNAVSDIMTYNPLGFRYRNYYNDNRSFYQDVYTELNTSFANKLTPIVPNLIGGIALFENTLIEDPNQYYAPESNPIIGYSSNNVNTNDNPKRGSMNQSESKQFTDDNGNKGYRFVFDFSTSQGNGIISSLGLTSKNGGIAMYGDNYDCIYSSLAVDRSQYYSSTTTISDGNVYAKQMSSVVAIDSNKNIGYFAYVDGLNTIKVGTVKIPCNKIGLFDKYTDSSVFDILSTKTLTTTNFASTHYAYQTNYYYYTYSTLINGDDNYIWGFQHQNNSEGNDSGDANILWIKINKNDWSFEEGSWTLPNAQLYRFGKYYYKGTNTAMAQNLNSAIIKDNILYMPKYDGYGIYKIPLDNPTNFQFIESSFAIIRDGIYGYSSYFYYNGTAVNDIGNRICYLNAFIENDKIIQKIYYNNYYPQDYPSVRGCLVMCSKPGLKIGPYIVSVSSIRSNNYEYLYTTVWLPMMYLATINNLISPIEKTADKTMKITYTLTEIAD